ncbi:MAG: helix-turn-helix domain-containing protein [Sphingomonadales bacterium]|nr:helix-turn-helix domain-containing protein [Sphingomonadales bacterium]
MPKSTNRILESAREALAFAEGRAEIADYRVHAYTALDIKAIRARTGLSQAMFAKAIGLEKRTLQDWEQGKRTPQGPARALLTVFEREPQAVLRALGAG